MITCTQIPQITMTISPQINVQRNSPRQPIALRVPRLRGTQVVHRTVLLVSFMKLFRLKAGL